MSSAKKAPADANGWAGTLEEWHARTIHHIEGHSGMRFDFRFRTLGQLIALTDLPDQLIQLALLEETRDVTGGIVGAIASDLRQVDDPASGVTAEQARENALEKSRQVDELNRRLVAFCLVTPKVTAEQLAGEDFPEEDLQMLSGIVSRQLQFDAAGRRIGVEPIETFATFRDVHECAPDCAACEAGRDRLSSVHVGGV